MFSFCVLGTLICVYNQSSAAMSEDQTVQTLNYLQDAGHLLQQTAPEISAHLLHHRRNLALKSIAPTTDVQRQHVCIACGQIFVLGVNSGMTLRPRKRVKSSKSDAPDVAPEQGGLSKVLSCGSCHQATVIGLSAPGPVSRRKQKQKSSLEIKLEANSSTAKPNINSSSKKRAKNRKAGLQALLSSQPKQNKSLSLADFMR